MRVPCPTGNTGAKQATMILQGSIDSIGVPGSPEREQWQTAFKTQLAFLMDIDKIRMQILDVRAASIMVEVLVTPPLEDGEPTSDAALEQLQAAVAATPPPEIVGMTLVGVDVRSAPPAPPFSPGVQLYVPTTQSQMSLESTLSALSGAGTTGGSGMEIAGMGAMGMGSVLLILVACMLRRHARRQREQRLKAAAKEKAIEMNKAEVAKYPDSILPAPPSLPLPEAMPPTHNLPLPPIMPPTHTLPRPLHSMPVTSALPPPSAFADDNVPRSTACLSKPSRASNIRRAAKSMNATEIYLEDFSEDVQRPSRVSLSPAAAAALKTLQSVDKERLADVGALDGPYRRALTKHELIMRDKFDVNSRLRKVIQDGTVIRVMQQRAGSDGTMRALVTLDTPGEDLNSRLFGWITSAHKGEEFIDFLDGQPDATDRTLLDVTDRTVLQSDDEAATERKSVRHREENIYLALKPDETVYLALAPKADETVYLALAPKPEHAEQTYVTRITLKMRVEADMKSAPAGQMLANTHVHVRERCTLADGTRRAHVFEVGSSLEKSGWLSCVGKDGAETLLPSKADDVRVTATSTASERTSSTGTSNEPSMDAASPFIDVDDLDPLDEMSMLPGVRASATPRENPTPTANAAGSRAKQYEDRFSLALPVGAAGSSRQSLAGDASQKTSSRRGLTRVRV